MSTEIHVEDDDNVVDRKTKEQILNLRSQVDDDERTLYVERMSDPQHSISIPQANQYWGISVRQYLRGIKRLWSDDESMAVRNVNKYWSSEHPESLVIGRETLIPPDKDGYQFSITQYHDEYSDQELRRMLGLPRGVEVPKPREHDFKGLQSVLSTNRLEASWIVKTDTRGPPPDHESIQLYAVMPIPKHILENAVEAADNFLQQAGIGFEIGVPDYMGGDGPGL